MSRISNEVDTKQKACLIGELQNRINDWVAVPWKNHNYSDYLLTHADKYSLLQVDSFENIPEIIGWVPTRGSNQQIITFVERLIQITNDQKMIDYFKTFDTVFPGNSKIKVLFLLFN